jgi:hypothetical protein
MAAIVSPSKKEVTRLSFKRNFLYTTKNKTVNRSNGLSGRARKPITFKPNIESMEIRNKKGLSTSASL